MYLKLVDLIILYFVTQFKFVIFVEGNFYIYRSSETIFCMGHRSLYLEGEKTVKFGNDYVQYSYVLVNNVENSKFIYLFIFLKSDNRCFEDVSFHPLDHLSKRFKLSKVKGTQSELVGSCIIHWTAKWLFQNTFRLHNLVSKHLKPSLTKSYN